MYVLLHVHIQEEGENGVEEHSLEMRVDVEMMELEVEVEADSVGVKVIALVGRSLQSLKVKWNALWNFLHLSYPRSQ